MKILRLAALKSIANRSLCTNLKWSYHQSNQYLRTKLLYQDRPEIKVDQPQMRLLEHVLTHATQGKPEEVIKSIDDHCQKYAMIHVGEEKTSIVKDAMTKKKPKSILELGCYCGYSSLVMAYYSNAMVHTIQPIKQYISIAKKIHEHAGIADRITIHEGTIQSNEQFIKQHGSFDMMFFDHVKQIYLQDLKWLELRGAIKKGTVIVADNVIYPGSPRYLAFMKGHDLYASTLYHSFQAYTDIPDAVLISERVKE